MDAYPQDGPILRVHHGTANHQWKNFHFICTVASIGSLVRVVEWFVMYRNDGICNSCLARCTKTFCAGYFLALLPLDCVYFFSIHGLFGRARRVGANTCRKTYAGMSSRNVAAAQWTSATRNDDQFSFPEFESAAPPAATTRNGARSVCIALSWCIRIFCCGIRENRM